MSSPEAAKIALNTRLSKLSDDELEQIQTDETDYSPFIFDYTDTESFIDIIPTNVVRKNEITLEKKQKNKLKLFMKQAEAIIQENNDSKINILFDELINLFNERYHPIIFCRFIATAKYLKKELDKRFDKIKKHLNIKAVTGELAEDERETYIEELSTSENRLLIATDCLSEGINLQESFNAVIHYDLPWNPNRLEQREGRIDRFGQPSKNVKTLLLYGKNNPIDGSVLKVLIRKAREIHKTLGITVPLPIDSDSVMETVIKTLFKESDENRQLELFDNIDLLEKSNITDIHKNWDKSATKEKKSRTIFAQHSIKPNEVAKELELTDKILGNPKIVEEFVKSCLRRLGIIFKEKINYTEIDINTINKTIQTSLNNSELSKITFETPSPEGLTYISRNHNLTVALSEYILNEALSPDGDKSIASRASVIRSKEVDLVTVLFLLRVRYIIENRSLNLQSIAEECIVMGYKGLIGDEEWFSENTSKELFEKIKPSGNLPEQIQRKWIREIIENDNNIDIIKGKLEEILQKRSKEILSSHKNIRQSVDLSTNLSVKLKTPIDIIAVTVILPEE
jgi:hypothetical protein